MSVIPGKGMDLYFWVYNKAKSFNTGTRVKSILSLLSKPTWRILASRNAGRIERLVNRSR
jgi:hypothetical protein